MIDILEYRKGKLTGMASHVLCKKPWLPIAFATNITLIRLSNIGVFCKVPNSDYNQRSIRLIGYLQRTCVWVAIVVVRISSYRLCIRSVEYLQSSVLVPHNFDRHRAKEHLWLLHTLRILEFNKLTSVSSPSDASESSSYDLSLFSTSPPKLYESSWCRSFGSYEYNLWTYTNNSDLPFYLPDLWLDIFLCQLWNSLSFRPTWSNRRYERF